MEYEAPAVVAVTPVSDPLIGTTGGPPAGMVYSGKL
jgi:hypothetical protein